MTALDSASMPPLHLPGEDAGSELRLDYLTGRWVVISPRRAELLRPFPSRSAAAEGAQPSACPLCPDRSDEVAVLEVAGTGSARVRVLPNRYPIVSGDEDIGARSLGPVFTQGRGSGAHEVLVLSDDHEAAWSELSDEQIGLVMTALRRRFGQHAEMPGISYSHANINSGREAGASLEHPHGQLLGLPFVPREMLEELGRFEVFKGNCLLCTTLVAEGAAGHRLVHRDEAVTVICPFWSGVPYEMLVIPSTHEPHLHHAPSADLDAVGLGLRAALIALRRHLGDPAYNVMFHSAPYSRRGFHWHLHVVPRIVTQGGFEMGTGVAVNVIAPERAASELREAAEA